MEQCWLIVLVLSVLLSVVGLTLLGLLIQKIRKCCRREDKPYGLKKHQTGDYSLLEILDEDDAVDGGQAAQRRPTLDLHGKTRQEALQAVDQFILSNQNSYHKNKTSSRLVNIITGRGLHSVNNFPVLKMETQKYLEKKGLNYSINSKGGQLTVDLKS
ncbi:NEDD4-binding protein 2 [Biomphalaria glabrata]|uniref:Uncharacterized protein LOC106054570 n=1 Tax=Biomphalaria glabrata TaxID=6526 RepID=A0A9W3B1W3_BIOGL|nr:uncharacterized protein LOC106054570 [Biomphalaria glabrata]XP_055893487.1 uncharacterized protein LOC106054570 [Biomphalaria glabrata]KAI8756791.1 smr domain-containing protein C11H11.03c-like [Biomphalaria glabrata]